MILELKLIKNSPDSVKENILLSLGDIFKLMGSRFVTPARFKILAILRTAISLKNNSFVYLGLKAWDSFIHWYIINYFFILYILFNNVLFLVFIWKHWDLC